MKKTDRDKNRHRAWLTVADAADYSGLSRSLLYRHLDENSLVSSTVKLQGRKRGRRLICRKSLDQLIETGIGQVSADNTKSENHRPS
ncbi:helix-turn-helix domain-containing protein [Akkermansiaceae bacterium]|nr:helix-turn-helix domain-containing protein [Akkermansiaceae bacterium]